MKIGTDPEESLYDRNEVILNAKKFDSLVNRMKFSSTEDLDDIDGLNSKTASSSKEDSQNEVSSKHGLTNTVNSKEFREYLNKHGLVLFPVKKPADGADTKEPVNLKKKTMMKRLSSMFARSKMPYSAENERSFVALDRKSDHSRYFPTNSSENSGMKNNVVFLKTRSDSRNLDIDDCKSSISSVLSAADTEDYLSSPVWVTKKTETRAPSTGFRRNQLYQSLPRSYYSSAQQPITAINNRKSLDKRENHDQNNLKYRQSVATNYRQYVQSPIDHGLHPFTFATIHQIKRNTDENFRKDSSYFDYGNHKIPQQNLNVNRRNVIEPSTNVVLRNGEYQKNLNNYNSPRSSLVSPVKEVSREEVMNKIYEYYRKSVNNTPVPTNVQDSLYSTLPLRPVKEYQAYTFPRISNPIQNQQKIYDEVHPSSQIPVATYRNSGPKNSSQIPIATYRNSGSKKVPTTSTPMKDKTPNQFSPKKMNSSQRGSLYSSQVFRPIAELCSRIFTDPRTPKKSRTQVDGKSSSFNKSGEFYLLFSINQK